MRKEKKLLIERSIFVFIIAITFSFIIINEKKGELFLPIVQKKFNNHIETHYNKIINDITIQDIKMKGNSFQAKVVSNENKNLFFYLTYSNHKTKDTYQKDYIKGNSLLSHIKMNLQKEIQEKTNIKYKVIINSSLNQFTNVVRERIIKEENLPELKIYILKKELTINNWNSKEITKEISSLLEKNKKNNINPKSLTIIIHNKQDITESIKIENINDSFITKDEKEQIINDIINDNNSLLLKQNKITYQYLN